MAEKSTGGIPPITTTVISTQNISQNMRRIVLAGDGLTDFPPNQESSYVKLLFEQDGVSVRRSYTVRAFDPINSHLTLDFMMHEDGGPASIWASTASIGSKVDLTGPGAKKLVDFGADWFLLAGDMTALPAISTNIEQLPADARGYVAIEIISAEDVQELPIPASMNISWVVNPRPSKDQFPLLEKVKELEFLEGRPSMWVAGEFHTSRAIRRYLKLEKGVQRDEIYASSYWHIGLTDERHKVAKKTDID